MEATMNWKSIVVGVDPSAEGTRAAIVASQLAKAAKVPCHAVHAVREPFTQWVLADVPVEFKAIEQDRIVLDSARTLVTNALADKVPAPLLDGTEYRIGVPAVVIANAADAHDADLVVLGGKHHSTIGRWLAGSTVHYMVRSLDHAVLVVGAGETPSSGNRVFRRILAAVDFSEASEPTLRAAEDVALAFGAELRLVHAVEPMPAIPEIPVGMEGNLIQRAEEELQAVKERVRVPATDWIVRLGPAANVIADVAAEWKADLVVVGTHGRGWVDRVLIGSVTERLLNLVPTSMLVIPISAPAVMRTGPVLQARRGRAKDAEVLVTGRKQKKPARR
jgi:nucleotide-binding universal stress UspA family protein